MSNKSVEIAEVVFQLMKYNHKWATKDHVIIYSDNIIDLEDGRENEIIAEYPVNRAKLKKYVIDRIG